MRRLSSPPPPFFVAERRRQWMRSMLVSTPLSMLSELSLWEEIFTVFPETKRDSSLSLKPRSLFYRGTRQRRLRVQRGIVSNIGIGETISTREIIISLRSRVFKVVDVLWIEPLKLRRVQRPTISRRSTADSIFVAPVRNIDCVLAISQRVNAFRQRCFFPTANTRFIHADRHSDRQRFTRSSELPPRVRPDKRSSLIAPRLSPDETFVHPPFRFVSLQSERSNRDNPKLYFGAVDVYTRRVKYKITLRNKYKITLKNKYKITLKNYLSNRYLSNRIYLSNRNVVRWYVSFILLTKLLCVL